MYKAMAICLLHTGKITVKYIQQNEYNFEAQRKALQNFVKQIFLEGNYYGSSI